MSSLLSDLERSLSAALDTLRKTPPGDLDVVIRFIGSLHSAVLPPDILDELVRHIGQCGPNDHSLHLLTMAIQSWDHATGEWTQDTIPHSEKRRELVLSRLGFSEVQAVNLNSRIPRFSASELPIIVAEDHEAWYEGRKPDIRDFYWHAYTSQLLPPRGNWQHDAVSVLDLSIDDVISRLSDPTREKIYPVRGLVMGYVQSGKTSHFSGLISKAADAGYRLVIVLAGTLDILRRQTQRRIDKELVGVELLGTKEYGRDADWGGFVSHGSLPSHAGAFDWERLTNKDDDYKTLSHHLSLLEFKQADRSKPFNHRDNLRSAPARIAIVKKVPARLNKLCDDLEQLREIRSRLEHVPTLVIDDESDQASINTIDQNKPGKRGDRTGTNQAIVRLLKLLPRAQYVGYTATPYANVFVDPADGEDLFPKDFIISLPRPKRYMGITDFFDFEESFEPGDYRGNKNAYVRPVEGENEDAENLPKAIDSFVLAGAIKLFRQAQDSERYRFRHHTMLVHHSSAQIVHASDRALVDGILRDGARYQSREGLELLEKLYAEDFLPVTRVRDPEAPQPKSFAQLKRFISLCLTQVSATGRPVRIVNGDGRNRDDTPDFDAGPVWAILVGGTKLSRGYTVEGLTVSYYRRPAGAGDTLMQMGRWFGFREGYSDLVRLFLGTKEPKGKTLVDLYEAFGAVCRDEEALRVDLRKYSSEGIKPRQVPPLVRQHLPGLPPTSRNKMFNAQIQSRDFGGEWTEKTSAPTLRTAADENLRALEELLEQTELSGREAVTFTNLKSEQRKFNAIFGMTDGWRIVEFLKSYKWADGRESIALERKYIERQLEAGYFAHWHILLPQGGTERVSIGPFHSLAVIERARASGTRFGAYSEPRHREAVGSLAGTHEIRSPGTSLANRAIDHRPVLLVYLVKDKNNPEAPTSVGFGIQYPGVKRDKTIEWTVKDPSNEKSVVVSAG